MDSHICSQTRKRRDEFAFKRKPQSLLKKKKKKKPHFRNTINLTVSRILLRNTQVPRFRLRNQSIYLGRVKGPHSIDIVGMQFLSTSELYEKNSISIQMQLCYKRYPRKKVNTEDSINISSSFINFAKKEATHQHFYMNKGYSQ